MLSQIEIERLMAANEIAIAYAFAKIGNGSPEDLHEDQFVDVSDSALPATKMFRENFFADRLRLTLGPIVMSHDKRYYSKRPAFKGRPGYFDIRSSSNQITIEPHETISVSTNERIRLGGKIGAYIIPRLRNVDSGLLYIPSYIDPHWDGIMQALIVNVTDHRQVLELCEGLAICRFYLIQGEVSKEVMMKFPTKSHHYGQSWQKILHGNVDPIPRRKVPLPPQEDFNWRIQKVKEFIWANWKKLVALGYTGGLFVLIAGYYKFQADIQKLTKLEELPQIKQDLKSLSERAVQSGVETIPIPEGRTSISHTIEVKRQPGITSTVWVSPITASNEILSLSARVDPLPKDNSMVIITIDLTLSSRATLPKVLVQWLLVPY